MGRFRRTHDAHPTRPLLRDEMTGRLRRELWNVVWQVFSSQEAAIKYGHADWLPSPYTPSDADHALELNRRFWVEVLEAPLHRLGRTGSIDLDWLAEWFLEQAKPLQVYDAIDFIVSYEPRDDRPHHGIADLRSSQEQFNAILQRELSPWRFIDYELRLVSNPDEAAAVEQAVLSAPDLVQRHLRRALDALSDRQAPDVHRAITESVQAIECMAKHALGSKGGHLGSLKEKLVKRGVHKAFASAVDGLYGYTSEEGGLRHSFKPGQNPHKHFAEARFFVVTASAFVNYLLEVHGSTDDGAF